MNIVYSYYVLDIVHRGHLLMMKNSKAIAGPDGRLIVGIVSDEAVIAAAPDAILMMDRSGDHAAADAELVAHPAIGATPTALRPLRSRCTPTWSIGWTTGSGAGPSTSGRLRYSVSRTWRSSAENHK